MPASLKAKDSATYIEDQVALTVKLLRLVEELQAELAETRAEVQAISRRLPVEIPDEASGWMRLTKAWPHLKAEGVLSASHLRELIREGVLCELGGEVRNVSSGRGRPTWEINIPLSKLAIKRHFESKLALRKLFQNDL